MNGGGMTGTVRATPLFSWISVVGAAVFLGFLAFPYVAGAAEGGQRNILVILSHHDAMPWQERFHHGVLDRLAAGKPRSARLFVERMDKARFREDVDEELLARFLGKKYARRPIDVVIGMGFEAANFVKNNWKLFGNPKIIFATSYEFDVPQEIEGATVQFLMDSDYRTALESVLHLHPDTERVLAIADETPGAAQRIHDAKAAWSDLADRIEFEFLTDFKLEDLLTRVATLPENTVVYFLLVFRDNTGRTFVPRDVVGRIAGKANAPVYSHWDALMGAGLVGGYMISGELGGRASADAALRLLAGEPLKNIGFTPADARGHIFDWRQLRRWGIPDNHLPPGSDVRHRAETIYGKYTWQIWTAIVFVMLQALLIAALLVNRSQRLRVMGLLEERVSERTTELEDSNAALKREMAERENTEAARRASERDAAAAGERLVQAIETMSEAFAMFDADDRLVLFNTRYKEYHPDIAHLMVPGVTFEELIRPLAASGFVVQAEGREEAWIQERLELHRNPRESFFLPTAGGRWLQISERRTPDGLHVGVRTDVTELVRRGETLREAKERAEFANRAKSAFLANMSHELRTPLNSIIGFSEMLMGEVFGALGGEKNSEYVADINNSGLHLLRVINDILDLSKIEAGKMDLVDSEVAVGEAVDACVSMMKERASEAGVVLSIDVAEPFPPVRADSTQLKQILLNLLSNAVKFTPPGGRATMSAYRDGDGAPVFAVADTGIGIAAADIPNVLEPFAQVSDIMTRSHEGTGLGLSLARSLTELHGGTLHLASEVGVGTTVTVRLPAARVVGSGHDG